MIRYATLLDLKKISYLLIVTVGLSSCTIYQNIPDEDGIYANRRKKSKVVVVERNDNTNRPVATTNRNTGSNTFTRELERIDRINGTDILTDIENYSSFNDTIINETDSIYTPKSWGNSETNDVVVNINITPNNFGWGYWDPWTFDPYFNWGWNGWGWNSWAWNGWGWGFGVYPRWGFGWGWNGPYVNAFGGYHPFYHGLYWRRNRFRFGDFNSWQQYRYGRRVAYSGINRVGSRRGFNSVNYTSRNRRGSSTIRNNNSNSRRRSINQPNRRRNSSIRNSNTTRRRSSINSSRRSNSRPSVRSSRSNSRSSVNRGSRGSSSRGSSSRRGGGRRG